MLMDNQIEAIVHNSFQFDSLVPSKTTVSNLKEVEPGLIDEWRNKFNTEILLKYLSKNDETEEKISQNSNTYLRDEIVRITKLLKGESDHGFSTIQAWRRKKRGFFLEDDRLFIKPDSKKGNSLKVACVEDFFDILYNLHQEQGHKGQQKTENEVSSIYYGIPRTVIRKFITLCPICPLKSTIPNSHSSSEPIKSDRFWDKIQVSLIDMRISPDGEFNFIAHTIDEFSKFNILWPLKSKTIKEFMEGFERHILASYGLPRYVLVDKSVEFEPRDIKNHIDGWNKEKTTFMKNKPKKSDKTEIDSSTNFIQTLNKFREQSKSLKWVQILPKIMYHMNSQADPDSKSTPLELAFGLKK